MCHLSDHSVGVHRWGSGLEHTGPRAASLEPVDGAPAFALEETQVALFLARLRDV
jgi:hypothetical protein